MTGGGDDPRVVRARRWAAQRLHAPRAGEAVDLVRHLLAVQAQDLRAARLAVRARGRGLTAAGVDAALGDGSLSIAWLMRGTLHLVATEDLPWLLALTAPGRMATSRRRLGQEGVSADDAERAVAIVERALAEDGPQTRAELAERIARAGIRTAGQATPHLLMLAALRGVAVLGPVRDGAPAFVAWRGAPPAAPDGALAELARRYLAAHAPASAEDLAAWSGLPLRDARAGFAAARPPRRTAPPEPAPRLLGAFDPYLLGWRDRGFAVAPAHARRVHPGGGILHAVATAGGVAVGTWTARRRPGRLAVTIDPFEPLEPGDEQALREEAADVARFEGSALDPVRVVAPANGGIEGEPERGVADT